MMKVEVKATHETPFGALLYTRMREKGIHIWDQRPLFLTAAHTDSDVAYFSRVFKECVAEMQEAGFIEVRGAPSEGLAVTDPIEFKHGLRTEPNLGSKLTPKLGRDIHGNPAWFVANPLQPGKFIKSQLLRKRGLLC